MAKLITFPDKWKPGNFSRNTGNAGDVDIVDEKGNEFRFRLYKVKEVAKNIVVLTGELLPPSGSWEKGAQRYAIIFITASPDVAAFEEIPNIMM